MGILGEKPIFESITEINLFRGGKFLKSSPWKLISWFLERTLGSLYFNFLILKSSFMSWSTLRGFCPEKNTASWSFGHVQNQKVSISWNLGIFSKRLCQTTMLTKRATKFCVETRSPFSYISHYDPKTIAKHLIIVSWPECRPEFPSDADGGGCDGGGGDAPMIFLSGQTPSP